MSQFRQYLSASSFKFPLAATDDTLLLPTTAFGVVAGGGTGGAATGDDACIRMCRFNDTFLSALYEQWGQA